MRRARPLANYGFSTSPAWGIDLLAGFVAVSLVFGLWFVLVSVLGGSGVEVSLAMSEGSILVWLAVGFVTNLFSALVQDMVYFGIILKNAAEGIRAWDVTPIRAVVGGWVVGILFFILIHGGSSDPVILLNWAVGADVFGLLHIPTHPHRGAGASHWGARGGQLRLQRCRTDGAPPSPQRRERLGTS